MQIVALPKIGKLRIVDVLDYYDRPMLFTCESMSGQMYLVSWIEPEDKSDRWFYLPISMGRLSSVKQSIVSLYQAFSEPEDGWLWEVRSFHALETTTEVKQLLSSEILSDDLPDVDSFITYKDSRLGKLVDSSIEANQTKREIIDLALVEKDLISNEINASTLGFVLISSQELIHSLGYKSESKTRTYKIPKEQQKHTLLRASGLFAASFGIRLESANQDLFGLNEASIAIDLFIKLLEAKSDSDKLLPLINNIGLKSSSRYIYFLKTLKENSVSLSAEWASPSRTKIKKATLNITEAEHIISILEKEEKANIEKHTLRGELVGVYMDSKSFWFHSGDGMVYKGELSESLYSKTFQVPANVDVDIEETIKINDITQEAKSHYKLTDIREL